MQLKKNQGGGKDGVAAENEHQNENDWVIARCKRLHLSKRWPMKMQRDVEGLSMNGWSG